MKRPTKQRFRNGNPLEKCVFLILFIVSCFVSVNVLILYLKVESFSLYKSLRLTEKELADLEAIRDQFVWLSDVSGVKFIKSDSLWNEVHHDKEDVSFSFKEFQISMEKNEVVLHDASRDYYIKLDGSSAQLKKGEIGEYSLLYNGIWSVFRGVQVKTVDDVAYNDIPKKFHDPPKPILSDEISKVKIMVLLAAYRDPLCGNTVYQLFKTADFPERLRVSVAQQGGPEDPDCIKDYCNLDASCRVDSVRVAKIPLNRSRGVMPGRYHQLHGLQDEEFCLQIDAHSVFENGWDSIALEDWLLTENEMAVLTTYPNRAKDIHKQKYSPVRCSTKFSHQGMLVHGGNSAHNVRIGKTPYLSPFFGAGISFSKCHANWNVPYDPYMSFLFGGEEFNRAARLFTWGYDMYAPKRNFVYHYYDSDLKDEHVAKPPQKNVKVRNRDFFTDKNHLGSQTTLRWRKILGLSTSKRIKHFAAIDLDIFGLGTRRTLEQYLKFAGVDLTHSTETSKCDMIGRMKRMPFVYEEPFNPNGPNAECNNVQSYCCNALTLSRINANRFLGLSNQEVSSILKVSDVDALVQSRSKPYISPFADGNWGKRLPCEEQIRDNYYVDLI